MFFDIWKEKLAFPLDEYPKNKNGTLKPLYMSTVLSDSNMKPYWESVHQVGLVNLKQFSDYVE